MVFGSSLVMFYTFVLTNGPFSKPFRDCCEFLLGF